MESAENGNSQPSRGMTRCCRCGFICSRFDNSDLNRPSNETLLCVAFVSFMGFTSIQSIVAFIAKSEAMLGDSAAMAVDALTYGFNLYAEREKNEVNDATRGGEEPEIELSAGRIGDETNTTNHGPERLKLERQLQIRRRHLHLELVPPLMSVSILLIVIGFVLHKAIRTLILDAHRSPKEQSIPNLVLMMTFSCLNLLLDVVNVTCFARAKHLMGYNTEDTKGEKEDQKYGVIGANDGLAEDDGVHYEYEIHPENGIDEEGNDHESEDDDDRVNLNMCSAYTHVFADTLRSIAVIIASVIAEVVDSVTPEVADATAAVIVSVMILASLLPLFRGLLRTWGELRSITQEEQALLVDNEPNNFEGEIR